MSIVSAAPTRGALPQQTKQACSPKFGNPSIAEKLESTGKGMTLDGPGTIVLLVYFNGGGLKEH